jgi:hypothetical protein
MVELSNITIMNDVPGVEGYLFHMRYIDREKGATAYGYNWDKIQTFIAPNLKTGREKASEMITTILCEEHLDD